MPIFDVKARLETVGKETLHYETEVIWKDYASDFHEYAQSDPTVNLINREMLY